MNCETVRFVSKPWVWFWVNSESNRTVILNHVNNSVDHAKIDMTLLVHKNRGIMSVINYICLISVYCTICCLFIIKQ